MNPGNLALKLATVLAVVAFVAAVRWARGRQGSETTFRWAYHGMTGCLAFASVLLMGAILTHDFRFEYVVGYSSLDQPLIYLVSAFWAGQEGTYLLWALMGAVLGLALCRKTSWEPGAVMAAYLPTVGFLLVLMLDPGGNPFKMVAQVPPDGRGLNPLLQDPWMASHPPLVFLGYAAMTVPAVLALVAVARRRSDAWLGAGLRWSLAAFVLLGAGIILGGFWAYKVLGWGGYWGWDPVENASLIPWVVVTGLVHGLLVQRATGGLRRTNLTLALAGYVLVLYATFLTRSGVLADFSVHSFPAGTIYRLLVGILLVTVAVSVWALVRTRRTRGEGVETSVSWPFVLTSAIVLLAGSALFVLIGTSWPILSSLIGKASSLQPPFYNRVNLPLYIGLLALLGVAPFLGWGRVAGRVWPTRVAPSLALAVGGTLAAVGLGARGAGPLVLLFVALVALASNVIRFGMVAKVRLLHTGAAVAHIGFALMFVGIVASSAWGEKARVELPLGHPVEVVDRIVTFRGHVDGSEPEDRWRIAVQRPGEAETVNEITMYMLNAGTANESVFRRPAIVRELAGDVYVAPMGLEVTGREGGVVELSRDAPAPWGDAELTFVDLSTDRGGDAESHGMTVHARVRVRRDGRDEEVALPLGFTADGRLEGRPVEASVLPGVSLTLTRMSVEQGLLLVRVDDRRATPSQVLVAEISTKPMIGILWTGTILLGLGCVIAVARRMRDARTEGLTVPASRPRAAARAAAAGRVESAAARQASTRALRQARSPR